MKIIIITLLLVFLTFPVNASEFMAPEVPDSGRMYMPSATEDFGAGLLEIIKQGTAFLRPDLKEASKVCLGILACVMLVSVLKSFPGNTGKTTDFAAIASISMILMDSTGSMINLGVRTVEEISEYGKLLLPVMTGALASQGGIASSVAIYSGTVIFSTVLTNLIMKLLIPLVYLYLAISVGAAAVGEELLKNIRDGIKKIMVWCLKTLLYLFTGYIGITGVISGTTDATTLKVAKMTISGAVPVVGGILSDASEAVLVSAGLVKNAAGIYGMFAVISVWIRPFVKLAAHYLLLKGTAGFCGIFGTKRTTDLIGDFSSAMGLLMGMTGSVCLMLIISTACFMKGVA
jgi:stage III sporulation protein AE